MEVKIHIYVQLPARCSRGEPLDLDPSNWVWTPCLSIPTKAIARLSKKPYKWARFAVGVVFGGYGDLHVGTESSAPIIDYEADAVAFERGLYYHMSNEEKVVMFPIDSSFLTAKTNTPSSQTSRLPDFREKLRSRDGSCVLTGLEPYLCDGAHLVGHSKGDKV